MHNLKAQLQTLYKMTNLGFMQNHLGIEILQATQGILLRLTTYSLYYAPKCNTKSHLPKYQIHNVESYN